MFHQRFFKCRIINKDTLEYFFNLYEKAKFVFFDTETTGLKVRGKGSDVIVGATFAFEDSVSKDVFYIPLRHVFEGEYKENDRFSFLTPQILKYFPDFLPKLFEGEYYNVDIDAFTTNMNRMVDLGGKTYIAHNIGFDLHALQNDDISVEDIFNKNEIEDTQLMLHTQDEEAVKNLESLTESIFGVKKMHYKDTLKTITKEDKLCCGIPTSQTASFPYVQIPIGGQYSAEDVFFMKKFYPILKEGLEKDRQVEHYKKNRINYLKAL